MNPYHTSDKNIIGGTPKVCPKCKRRYSGYPAISREDNKTNICPSCGQREALEKWAESGN